MIRIIAGRGQSAPTDDYGKPLRRCSSCGYRRADSFRRRSRGRYAANCLSCERNYQTICRGLSLDRNQQRAIAFRDLALDPDVVDLMDAADRDRETERIDLTELRRRVKIARALKVARGGAHLEDSELALALGDPE
jgi:hypothetical protein